METADEVQKKIDAAIQMLQFTQQETETVLTKNAMKPLQRHLKTIEDQLEEIEDMKVRMQKLKIGSGKEPQEVRSWSQAIDEDIISYERTVDTIQEKIAALKERALEEERQREEEIAKLRKRRHFEEEIRLEEEKLRIKRELERKMEEEREKVQLRKDQTSKAKLPKLIITKFQGTHIDWQRFWSQFEAEIDRAEIGQVAKFSYLKELLIPKVRLVIDGLPFTTEGYERAKQILKTKYGKPSEVANAHIQNLLNLPSIYGTSPVKIHDFYEKLVTNVQVLETMGKLREVTGYVRMTLDKLPGIRADLVRMDDDWQEWEFSQLVEALRKWCERNPIPLNERRHDAFTSDKGSKQQRREKVFQVKQHEWKPRPCVYCDSTEHKSSECQKVKSVTERKRLLSVNKLCFNCTGEKHRATECRSKFTCQKCSGKHHTSICDKDPQQILVATGESSVIYPVVVVEVNGIKCRALLDTGAGSTYVSATLAERIGKKPIRKETRRIDMMMHTTSKKVEIYHVQIASVTNDYKMMATVTKVDKTVLLSLPNPQYERIIQQHQHLKEVIMEDKDKKPELPIHMILGASEYAKIKTETKPKVGDPGKPVAELTALGWTIMSPGKEADLSSVYLTRSSTADYQDLCKLDVLGLEDRASDDQVTVFEDFKEQLTRSPEGWYETGLLWKSGHAPLPNNKSASLGRLSSLVRRLKQNPQLLDQYDEIIQEQLDQNIIEEVKEEPKGREFYIPHKPVIRETAESTKMRIVYDASARANEKSPSLNDCLETGPPLQNLMWSVLIRNRFKPVALAGDMKQAFLQIRIREADRDSLRFHWIKNKDSSQVQVYRFTRALFGLVQSPFLLGGTIEMHLDAWKETHPEAVAEIQRSLYVDDVITGMNTVEETKKLMETTIGVFKDAQFILHKWHSNAAELEKSSASDEQQQTFAKEQLGVKDDETKLLGLKWNKSQDTLKVTFPEITAENTKRGILRYLASIFDPLGFVSPITLLGKFVYRDTCEKQLPWDKEISHSTLKQWKKFEDNLPESMEVPRSLVAYREEIDAIDLHIFGDTSGAGTAAVIYAVVYQRSGTNQGLVASKARLAKKGLTIPRLELVSAHMAANLAQNVKDSLQGLPVRHVYGWLDSSVALHWINGGGSYKQFVANRIKKIHEKDYIQWRHVPTNENPADIASRGGSDKRLGETWSKGPSWLSIPTNWPQDILTQASADTEAEAKLTKEVLGVAVEYEDELLGILEKHSYWKSMRITTWIARFIHNCTSKKSERLSGPLTTEEIDKQIKFWVRREQRRYSDTEEFKADQLRLNLQGDENGIYKCRGRIQGVYPKYLPAKSSLSAKMVMDAHVRTLHGGVGLTMEFIRRDYWIPRLRQLAKKVITRCNGCKRFQARAFASPPEGNLPIDRTEGSRPFQVVGVDYAGPIIYKRKQRQEGKAYILLFACSLTRALYLELLPDQTAEEFLKSLKRFIARKGRPEKIYSDNGKTFVAGAKWLKKIMKEESLQNFLAHQHIKWQFNLSKAPWWGGQFERMVGLVKQSLYKTLGRACLSWSELEEVILDIELALNNRPLSYVEDDVQLPILTPNMMMFGIPNHLPEEDADNVEDTNLRKRAKYLRKCKDSLWTRWTGEYVKALRERHNLKHDSKTPSLKEGDVMLIKGEERNRGKWNIGIITNLIIGRDGVVRAARLRAGKSYLERAVQQLYPLELSCDMAKQRVQDQLNPEAKTFRPRRRAAANAAETVKIIAEEEDDEF